METVMLNLTWWRADKKVESIIERKCGLVDMNSMGNGDQFSNMTFRFLRGHYINSSYQR